MFLKSTPETIRDSEEEEEEEKEEKEIFFSQNKNQLNEDPLWAQSLISEHPKRCWMIFFRSENISVFFFSLSVPKIRCRYGKSDRNNEADHEGEKKSIVIWKFQDE